MSYLPCFTPLLLIGVPLLLLFKSWRAAKIAAVCSACALSLLLLIVYIPGWLLYAKAAKGDPAAEYRYAQWLENHSDQLGDIILWPVEPDALGGYAWLEKAAAKNYPPAVWLVGVRLKHGLFVPEPRGWTGPGGNSFEQPDRGQPMIDRAINQLGYMPPEREETFYDLHYRRGLPP
ncbi:MAG TPA: hypothetical protein VHS31_08780 [Tepidisphaeraceae bacterium]|nr:hypothetical protein [Tepidisphaeraceae bacterium]